MNEFDREIRALVERGEPVDHHTGGDVDIETGDAYVPSMGEKDSKKLPENVVNNVDIAPEANTGGNNSQR